MLRLVLGRAGSGKNTFLLEKAKLLASKKKQVLLIVPEQASFVTERAVLALLGASDSRYVEVLSFTRLCERIFRSEGFFTGRRIDDSGKAVVMSNALETVCHELSIYKKHGRGTGLINIMLSAVTEFKTRRISPDDLSSAAAPNETLSQKLRDVSLIYSAYEAIMEQTGLDPLDDISRACKKLENSGFFADKTVMIDSFKSFTPAENEMIAQILRGAPELYVALCADSLDASPLFAPTARTARSLLRLADKCGAKTAPPVYTDYAQGKEPVLRELERNIFSYEYEPFESEDQVRVFSAATAYEECSLAAAELARLVRDDGLRYRDIAVVARNFDDYSDILEDVFERAGLPVFFDRREPVSNSPLIKLVYAMLDISCRSFRTEDILRYLKTDLAGLCAEEISKLENYAAVWQINGRAWREPFTLDPSGFTSDPNEERVKEIETLRERVIAPLERFSEKIKSESCREISAAIYEMLVESGVPERLDADGLRVWDILTDMLDRIVSLRSEPIKAAKYCELLQLMLSTADMGFIPQGLDEITAGAADRIRLNSPKVVWILGANEGVFPMKPPSGSIFTENERRALIENGLNMADTAEMCVEDEKMLAYMTAAAPTQRLFISFPRGKTDGSKLMKSELVDAVLEIMPCVKIEDASALPPPELIASERSAFSEMALRWNENTPFSAALRQYFEPTERFRALENSIGRAKMKLDPERITHRLFGSEMRVSASKVEIFHQCKFQYFCRYALGIQKRREAKLDALEYGKVMHYVFEKILQVYNPAELWLVTDSELETRTYALLDEYICENMGGWEDKTERFKYLYKRMVTVLLMLIRRMGREFAQSDFQPVDFELKIGRGGEVPALELETPSGEKLAVEGFIDRVDVMKRNGKSYIRIVDYKTGTKDFELTDVLHGINLQMLIYLITLDKNGACRYGEVVPSGVLYMSAKRPKSVAEREVPDLPTVEVSGLLLDDPAVLRSMDRELSGIFIPVKVKKDGALTKRECLASLEEIGELSAHIEKLLTKMAQALYEGDIEALGAHEGEYCEFCDYFSVCGHEKSDGGKEYKKFPRDDVYAAIREELSKDE